MAKRRAQAIDQTAESLLPLELVRYVRDEWSSTRDFHRAKAVWFRAHGIDPGDWSAVHPILKASGLHHGHPLAADQARLRLRLDEGSGT